MTDEPMIVHRTPPMVTSPAQGLPLEPEKRNHIDIELVGGPHHGYKMRCWEHAKRIEMPVVLGAQAEKPEVTAEIDKDGQWTVNSKREPLKADGVIAIYTRADETSTTAVFTDFV